MQEPANCVSPSFHNARTGYKNSILSIPSHKLMGLTAYSFPSQTYSKRFCDQNCKSAASYTFTAKHPALQSFRIEPSSSTVEIDRILEIRVQTRRNELPLILKIRRFSLKIMIKLDIAAALSSWLILNLINNHKIIVQSNAITIALRARLDFEVHALLWSSAKLAV